MLTLENLKGKKIGIVGFGKEGQAIAGFLNSQHLVATVYDQKTRENFSQEVLAKLELEGFLFQFADSLDSFGDTEIIFRSPGFPRLSSAIIEAESRGAVITSQTKWFFDNCPAPIIGVTGTKGKGTTVTLIAEILNKAKALGVVSEMLKEETNVYVTGNIGKDDPFVILEHLKSTDLVVFELSSFQLQDLTRSPKLAVCLMVTQEHLDHHKDVEEYRKAKSSIVNYQSETDFCVYNTDYPGSVEISLLSVGRRFAVSRRNHVKMGVFAQGEQIVVSGMLENGSINVANRLLRGSHNLENICAAVASCVILGIPLEIQKDVILDFKGLEHRLEFVGEFRGVRFYNDSISTVPESSIAAIEAFSQPKIIILGGSDKGSEFDQLAKTLERSNMRGVILVGQMTDKIQNAINEHMPKFPILTGARNMQEIFSQIREIAQSGDVVVLSPACASFDMFINYKDRGDQFKRLANSY